MHTQQKSSSGQRVPGNASFWHCWAPLLYPFYLDLGSEMSSFDRGDRKECVDYADGNTMKGNFSLSHIQTVGEVHCFFFFNWAREHRGDTKDTVWSDRVVAVTTVRGAQKRLWCSLTFRSAAPIRSLESSSSAVVLPQETPRTWTSSENSRTWRPTIPRSWRGGACTSGTPSGSTSQRGPSFYPDKKK